MLCPVDKNPLIVVEWNQIELDHCAACQGVWFDAGELDLLLKKVKIHYQVNNALDLPPAKNVSEPGRKCPICGKVMQKRMLGDPPDLVIDACGRGHGLWFDKGEVKHLLTEMAAHQEDPVASFLNEVFRALD